MIKKIFYYVVSIAFLIFIFLGIGYFSGLLYKALGVNAIFVPIFMLLVLFSAPLSMILEAIVRNKIRKYRENRSGS